MVRESGRAYSLWCLLCSFDEETQLLLLQRLATLSANVSLLHPSAENTSENYFSNRSIDEVAPHQLQNVSLPMTSLTVPSRNVCPYKVTLEMRESNEMQTKLIFLHFRTRTFLLPPFMSVISVAFPSHAFLFSSRACTHITYFYMLSSKGLLWRKTFLRGSLSMFSRNITEFDVFAIEYIILVTKPLDVIAASGVSTLSSSS